MEQLSLSLTDQYQASPHHIFMFKDDTLVLDLHADCLAEAQVKRRALVEVLQRDPRNRTVWEDVPRPTGWWGIRRASGPTVPTTVYNIIIERSPDA